VKTPKAILNAKTLNLGFQAWSLAGIPKGNRLLNQKIVFFLCGFVHLAVCF
jgi:hypothetical protein